MSRYKQDSHITTPNNGSHPWASLSIRALLFALVGLLIMTIIMMELTEILGGDSRLRAFVAEAGTLAPLVYISVKALTYVVAPLSGLSLKILAGALFGWYEGVIYSTVGEAIGGSINFWLARVLGRRLVTKLVGIQRMSQIDVFASKLVSWRVLLVARLLFSAFYDFVSYAAGLVTLPYWQYITVSIIGGLVSTSAWVGIGNYVGLNHGSLFLISIGLAVLVLAVILLEQYLKRDHSLSPNTVFSGYSIVSG